MEFMSLMSSTCFGSFQFVRSVLERCGEASRSGGGAVVRTLGLMCKFPNI